jgi:anti-anti-sigma factor
MIGRVTHPEYPWSQPEFAESAEGEFAILRLPPALTASAVPSLPWGEAVRDDPRHWLLEASGVRWVDAAGLGYLLGMHKRLRMLERYAVLIAPSMAIRSALIRSRIDDLLLIANDYTCGRELARQRALGNGCSVTPCGITDLRWDGEITAANALDVFERTWQHLSESAAGAWQVDMSGIRFADSTGLAMMLRLRAEVRDLGGRLTFRGVTPALLKIARLENLDRRITEDPGSGRLPEPVPAPSAAASARIVPPKGSRPFSLAGRSAASK